MSRSVRVVWDEDLASYDFGRGHPLAPLRVELTVALARELGVLDLPGVSVVPATVADDDLLALVHSESYIAAVRACSEPSAPEDHAFGLGTDDNPRFDGMHAAAAHVVGATVEAARSVWTGESEHAVSLAGGLHHAMADTASGFCVYNDIAVAIAWLLENGAERVAYVDVDVHHGDGVEAIFRDDPRVLTVSIHESGHALFPGTGFIEDIGTDGTTVNVPLAPGTGDVEWLRAFDAVVPPLLEAFAPDVLVTQQGCDSHLHDPLAHLALTVDGQRATYARLHDLAHAYSDGRWVATGGGGYSIIDVVPRAWTHLLAVVAGAPIDVETVIPERWRDLVLERTGREGPTSMGDGADPAALLPQVWPALTESADDLDQVVRAVRAGCYPQHGLAP
jgi:acetoin utilization protein AcuC